MGGTKHSKISNQHILHYTIPNQNRLYLFDTNTERLFCIPIFHQGKPFFFGHLKTITCPQRQCLFIIGGEEVTQSGYFEYIQDQKIRNILSAGQSDIQYDNDNNQNNNNPQSTQRKFDINHIEDVDISVLEQNMNVQVSLFAQVKSFKDEYIDSNIIGYIDFKNPESIRLNIETQDIIQLQKARIKHSLVYQYPNIYIIGGRENNIVTNKCLKYNIIKNELNEIASIQITDNIDEPATLIVENQIYVFNTYSQNQNIQRYNMIYDMWEEIQLKTKDFKIERTLNSIAFQIDTNQIILLNGKGKDKKINQQYYIYDIEKEEFIQERTDKKLLGYINDNQGNRNYKKSNKIYCQLNDRKVKVFYKNLWLWSNMDLYMFKMEENKRNLQSGIGCCSRRTKQL